MKTSPISELVIWRDSVCAGDDCDAPHTLILPLNGDSLRRTAERLLGARYLASISGGRATWILDAGMHPNRSLAVFAQQWAAPRFLVAPDVEISSYVDSRAEPHLHFRYWCQADPQRVFECLLHDDPLPDRYGR